jgi:TonB family protein
MRSLDKVSQPLRRQWLQSALLHGALLLCAALYHLHSHDSLPFSANSFDKTSASAMAILIDNNIDLIELSFEQYDNTEPQEIDARLAEEPIDASLESLKDTPLDSLIDAPIDSLIDIPLDVQKEMPKERLIAAPMTAPKGVLIDHATHATKKITIEVETAKKTEPVVSRERAEQRTITSKSSLQRAAPEPVRSARAPTQPTSRATPSANQAATQLLQTARPDHAHNPKPDYPLALRDQGISGVVWLRVWVDPTGRPREIELAKGSGYRLFDEAALRAVQHWRFIPAKSAQQSFASWVEFAVRFELNG